MLPCGVARSTFLTVIVLVFAGLVAAQEPKTTTVALSVSVPVYNNLLVSGPGKLEFYLEPGKVDGNSTSTLEFTTNDGRSHSIFVSAESAWAFTPSIAGTQPGYYPELRVKAVTSTAGLAATVPATVIGSDNAPQGVVEIVSAIVSATGTAQVLFEAANGHGVIAGTYQASLSFTLATP